MRARTVTADRGSATVLAAGIVAALAVLLAALVPVVALLGAHERATVAADAAALAAADTALGVRAGIPCTAAGAVAAADGATLARCRQTGVVVRVDVVVTALGIALPAAARAGPRLGTHAGDLRGPSATAVYGVRDRRPPTALERRR